LYVPLPHSDIHIKFEAHLQESELQVVFEYAPPSAQGAYQIPNKAREAYMKAINPHASVEEPIKEKEEEDGVNPKRKEAIGEDCPVYVTPPGPCFLSLFFLVLKKRR